MKKALASLVALFMSVAAMTAANPSGTLPVLHINTEGGAPILTKTDYVAGSYWLDPNGNEGIAAFGTEAAPLPLQIRGRGNYTWTGFDKKPYRLKLDKKQALMGMSKSKHWGLLAHADDNKGFLRNTVGFQLSRLIGLPWTPGDAPVEVMLNGEYIGLYFLTETVRVDKTRVNIYNYDSAIEDAEDALAEAKAEGSVATPDEIAALEAALQEARNADPAWLVEIDNYDDASQVQIMEGNTGEVMRFTYDNPDDYITDALRQSLIDEMTDIDRKIYDSDKSNCAWAENIDLTDLAKFFIVNQLVDNYESFHGSCKLFRDNAAHAAATGTDTKWHFSPVWDFGSSFNRSMQHMLYEDGDGATVWHNHWIPEMMKFPVFKAEVERVYAEFMDGRFNEIYDYITDFTNRITAAAASDLERWPQYGNSNLAAKAADITGKLRNSATYLNREFNYAGGNDPAVSLYLRGAFAGASWPALEQYRFTCSNGVYTLKVSEITGDFKIADADWSEGHNYGAAASGDKVALDTPYKLLSGSAFNCSTDGTYTNVTFSFVPETSTLTIISEGGGEPIVPGDPEPETDIYLRGEVNGWGATDSYRFTKRADGIYTLTIPSLLGAFKIAGPEWNVGNVDFGSGSVIAADTPVTLTYQGANSSVEQEIANPTLLFDWSTKTLTISTSGDTPIPAENSVYFHDRKENPWATVYIYVWKDENEILGGWPGKPMTDITPGRQASAMRVNIEGNEKLWKYEFDSADDHSGAGLIFHSNSGAQTKDQVLAHGHIYTNNTDSEETLEHKPFDGNITGLISNTGVDAAGLAITAAAGRLIVVADLNTTLTVTHIDGISFSFAIAEGENIIELPRGFYIVAGRKFAL